ncbi:alpha/beta fold hydrolase [Longispora albida]|uniref:alpha/beta fold hydrolase n=1 Tax=Longispora albida TaxID=203523 RepID=UPI000361C87B|nr:alpha/beta hydrolase [Longispora albida]
MTLGVAETDGGYLAYEIGGAGRRVVMLHGGLLNRSQWTAEAPALAATGHQVAWMDARGHGESSTQAGPYHPHEDVIALLDHLGWADATLVGLSGGARAAIDAALEHPERVAAMLLVAPGYSGMELHDPFVTACDAEMARSAGAGDLAGFTEAFLRAWVDGPMRQPGDVDPAVRLACQEMVAGTLARHAAGGPPEWEEAGAADRLGELAMPIEAVIGSLDSTDIAAAVQKIGAEARDARVSVVEGAGHVVNLDQPAAFGRLLAAFMQRTVLPE